jgi:hypothetical protein
MLLGPTIVTPNQGETMSDVQHCETCRTEFVAGVPVCTDCGGPLALGPLPERPAKGSPANVAAGDEYRCDRLLARLPGAQADVAAKALNLEGVTCLLECEGIRRLCPPDRESDEPLAVTLPVAIYVRGECEREAREILDSLPADVIGNQWAEEAQADDADEEVEAESELSREGTPPADLPAVRSESTTWRVIAIIAVGLFVLLMLSRR